MFQYVPLFDCLKRGGAEERALLAEMLASPEAWLRTIREGGTRTFEGWGRDCKRNASLFHLTNAAVLLFLSEPSDGQERPFRFSADAAEMP